MLTGTLVRVRVVKRRILPLYLPRDDPHWLDVAESLLLIFRDGVGMSRGEIESEVDELVGEGLATLAHRGLARVLEDRAEFEVVADVPPETLREAVFTAAAAHRRTLLEAGPDAAGLRPRFRRDEVLRAVAAKTGLEPERIAEALFADLKDENRMLRFDDVDAQRLVDRYNVALAQAVLLRAVRVRVEVRGEKPARYRQLFRQLKFHRLLHRIEGSMQAGYTLHIDGPLSLFSATNKYGLQMALFLPALLHAADFRLDAELRWGPRREPRDFHLESGDGLVSHTPDHGTYVPAEIRAFLDRFRQVAPAWEAHEASAVIDLGEDGVWVPDYRLVHRASGDEFFLEILGFWKRSSVDRLLRLLPKAGGVRFVLAISDRLKVDEEALGELDGPVLRFKEIPSAPDLVALLDRARRPPRGGPPAPLGFTP